mgnify:CR=1 FL=1
MIQNYPQYTQNIQFQTLKPNIKKILLKNLFKIISAVLLIVALFLLVHWQVGFDVFLVAFEVFGIKINQPSILIYLILSIVGVAMLLFLSNYLAASNLRYEFYQNRLIAYENSFLVLIKSIEVPYQNIVKVSYHYNGIFNRILNSGTIILELTGMKEDKIEMHFVDNVQQIVQFIENMRRRFMFAQQAQSTENYRVGKIINRLS